MKIPTKIAVTSRSFSRHPVLRAELLGRFENVTFNEEGRSLSGDALVSFLQGHERAITALEILDESVLSRLPDLKVISKYGVGLDMIDLGAMRRHGKLLGWTPGVNRRSVSELTLAFILSLLHRVPQGHAKVTGGQWGQILGNQLSEKTVGIIGCGNIGKDLVGLLAPFGCRVLAHDIADYSDFYARHGVKATSLGELLSESHVVTLHVPLDESTRNLLDASRLRSMRAGAILINCARGGILDEAAVLELLDSGHLAGAAFDVFAQEPPQDPRLLRHPNFLCTPHIGGSSEEAVLAMGRSAIAGLERANSV